MKTTSILIVEDHPLVRRGIRGLLQAQRDFRVIGEASNGLEALHLIEQSPPDVVITDIVMPMVGGLDLLRELSKQTPRPLLIVLSLFDEPRYIQEATEAGAAAYVLKQSAPTFLVTAIRDAMAGRFFCTPAVSGQALKEIETRFRNQPWNRQDLLTDDERLVLQLLGSGCEPAEITRRLAHQPLPLPLVCQNIVLKLGLPSQADLRRYAEQWTAKQN
ncbi:MAG: TRAP-type C4-dicarboxylate transporter periplasmic solute-binding protein [Limisphaerales bacterium]|nr:MAG: TRAP-type C4-dicarboxylate transporter periplasmic solute-binding protein [Limisphaerales bacterium]KAG0506871.1 MAG: TRAP-type C4-dicarboxylate transporter periplasmic solute-binding protein [Limisphaerales bacterium]TXT49868.1 MAG: TRAP-type C4-dicarboxylate transporter periplasmic solute-binding protein [Limisphaerales bacterium]